MSRAEAKLRWRHRVRVVEAAAWLLLARLLIAGVPLRWWRGSLGHRVEQSVPQQLPDAQPLRARRAVRAVAQAEQHLPLAFKCLPRAAALQWMLRRRGIPSTLLLGVLPARHRGTLNDLHAWVEVGEEVVLGVSDEPHAVLLRLATGRATQGLRSNCSAA